MPPLLLWEVARSGVDSQTIIPYHQCAWFIGGTDLEVGTLRNVVEEELQQVLRLFLLEADNAAREALVHIKSLLACNRVNPDEGVLKNNAL